MGDSTSSLYSPLADPARETRLLQFESEKSKYADNEPICCSLVTIDLGGPRRAEYHALSYCWGDRLETTPIFVNGRLHHVTRNLEAALRRVREIDRNQLIWADALCINQQDLSEKACQVNMMASIFSSASCCLLWLGNTSLKLGGDLTVIYEPHAIMAFDLIESLARGEHYTRSDNKQEGNLAPLMKLQWWHRIWTLQEAVLPPHCVVLCGKLMLPWKTITEASDNFRNHYYRMCCNRAVPSLKQFQNKVQEIEDMREDVLSDAGPNMSRIFQIFQARNASDPRDKVFGLLPLGATRVSSATTAAGISADYAATSDDVFTQTALKVIKETKSLEILLRCREYDRNPHLASWVPDLTARSDRHRFRELNKSQFWNLHDACGGREASFLEDCSSDGPNTLVLAGTRVDEITVVGDPCQDPQAFMAFHEGQIQMYFPHRSWRQLLEQNFEVLADYPVGQGNYEEAFMRVLTRDCLHDDQGQKSRISYRRINPDEVSACLREVKSKSQHKTYYQTKMINYRFFVTKGGLIGLGPVDTASGDTIFVLHGGRMPFVMRKRHLTNTALADVGESWQMLGDGFVQGIMDGECMDRGEREWVCIT